MDFAAASISAAPAAASAKWNRSAAQSPAAPI